MCCLSLTSIHFFVSCYATELCCLVLTSVAVTDAPEPFTVKSNFEALPAEELTSLESWVHHAPAVLQQQGRAVFWKAPKEEGADGTLLVSFCDYTDVCLSVNVKLHESCICFLFMGVNVFLRLCVGVSVEGDDGGEEMIEEGPALGSALAQDEGTHTYTYRHIQTEKHIYDIYIDSFLVNRSVVLIFACLTSLSL